jgi:histidine triad (HIT) family protein
MLSDEETEDIKQKLITQIESTFPPEQVFEAKRQVESMNPEQLEIFLEKNKLIKREDSDESNSENNCVFCSIASGKIKSVKLEENDNAVAVLEINPISKGHTMIIPKEHSDKVSKKTLAFAKKISKKIKDNLKPKSIEISNSTLFGHAVVNILPVYDKENFNSERKPAKIEELELIRQSLEKRTKPKKIVKEKAPKEIKENFWLPKRIP